MTKQLHIHDNWLVVGLITLSASTFFLIVFGLFQAWQRPVTVLSRIPFRSEIFDVLTGAIHSYPTGRYKEIGLQPGDIILFYDGRTWENTQRLNYHELSGHRPGEFIPLLIQREEEKIAVDLPVFLPDIWEKFVLLRFTISAFLCWFPSLVLLNIFRKSALSPKSTSPHMIDSSLPLWIITWNSLALFFATTGLKYPLIVLVGDILGRILPLMFAVCYLPYPFAPRTKRLEALTFLASAMGVVTIVAMLWNAFQSPFNDPNWLRSVQLLRPNDFIHIWSLLPMFLGFVLAVIGLLTTALSSPLQGIFRYFATNGPLFLQQVSQKLANMMEQIYGDCHPGIIIIFQYQFTVLLLFVFFDILPTILVGSGHGYNALWFCLPISYLFLYTNFQALQRIYYWLQMVLLIVLFIQFVTQYIHWQNQTFGKGGNIGDWLAIFTMLSGVIGAGIIVLYSQPHHTTQDLLQTTIDGLFLQPSLEKFWRYLTQSIGPVLGVSTWLWIVQSESGEWQIVAHTPSANPNWLKDKMLHTQLFSGTYYQRPISLVVDTFTLPTTLILLPIIKNQQLSEVIIAANPTRVRDGSYLLESPMFYNRLMSAVHALHSTEAQQLLINQQQQLANYQQHLAEAYRELQRQQRNSTRSNNLLLSATLHDKALQRLAGVVQELRHQTTPIELTVVEPIIQECVAIDHEIRRVLRDLRPKGSEQQLGAVLEDAVSQWEYQFRFIRFIYEAPNNLLWLSEIQRISLFLIINQAVENALEHGKPGVIALFVEQTAIGLRITVQDDGVGFVYDPEKTIQSLGLLLMRDVAEEIGANLTITTRPGAGCQITVYLPQPQ